MPADDTGLTSIVDAAASGDQQAWDALVHRFTPSLRRVAGGYDLSPHDIHDVVQFCWLALFENVRGVREPDCVGAWLATTARRQALRLRVRETREVPTEADLAERRAAPDCLETAVVEAERGRALREAVQRLPHRQRALLEAFITAPDQSYAEVSRTLDMPVGSIGPTRERGLSRLRRDERLTSVVAS
jgi:RNA polymerase sigma factor (sigma-70 family)